MKKLIALAAFGWLVGSQLTWIYPIAGQPAQLMSICRYSDHVVLTVPGNVCPGSD